MLCKLGNDPCHQIGCDCIFKAPIEEVTAELKRQGFSDADLERMNRQTNTVVRLCKEKLETAHKIQTLETRVEELEKALKQAIKELAPKDYADDGEVIIGPPFESYILDEKTAPDLHAACLKYIKEQQQ